MSLKNDTEQQQEFRTWVEGKKRISPKAASDVNSRAKRVERTLGRSLESLIGQGATYEDIDVKLLKNLEKEGGIPSSINDLRRAVRLYLEYKSS